MPNVGFPKGKHILLMKNIDLLSNDLNKLKIKNIKLKVSAPFHCKLMNKATDNMRENILNLSVADIKIMVNPALTSWLYLTPNMIGKKVKGNIMAVVSGLEILLEISFFEIISIALIIN